MKQLTQKLKDGKMQVLEVPVPVLGKGMVLVKHHFPLIRSGTEDSAVAASAGNTDARCRAAVGAFEGKPQLNSDLVFLK